MRVGLRYHWRCRKRGTNICVDLSPARVSQGFILSRPEVQLRGPARRLMLRWGGVRRSTFKLQQKS